VAAGLVFVAVSMWFADSTGGKAEMPLRVISTIVKGDQAMAAGTSPALGVAVHVVLSALFGMAFALAVPRFRTNGTVALAGTAHGLLLLYVVDFLVLTPLVFTTFKAANQPFEVFAHLVFGTLLSFAFFGSGMRRGEPVLAIQRRSAGALS
jgi:hypothetical protein